MTDPYYMKKVREIQDETGAVYVAVVVVSSWGVPTIAGSVSPNFDNIAGRGDTLAIERYQRIIQDVFPHLQLDGSEYES